MSQMLSPSVLAVMAWCALRVCGRSRVPASIAPRRVKKLVRSRVPCSCARIPLARFSSAPEIRPLHFTVEWAGVARASADLKDTFSSFGRSPR